MDEDETDIDWGLLPYKSKEFFGLSDPFTAKDLKRSYARLIKKFKPEKFPEEFQKIRRAYEILSSDFRYSHLENQIAPVQGEWAEKVEADNPESASPASSWNELAREELPDAYREVARRTQKTAYDYCCLAFLSDFVDDDKNFTDWILEGISSHYHDPGLRTLALEYFRSTQEPDDLVRFIRFAAKSIPSEQFLSFTEPAWEHLIRVCDFGRFLELVDEFERETDPGLNHAAAVFWVRLSKAAIWKADEAWIQNRMAQIEECYFDLPGWMHAEFEMLHLLIDYRSQREYLLNQAGTSTALIDQSIRDWCLLPQSIVDQKMLECQMVLSSRGVELIEEFEHPVKDVAKREAIAVMLRVWECVSHDFIHDFDWSGQHNEEDTAHVKSVLARTTRRIERGPVYAFRIFAFINLALVGLTGVAVMVARTIRAIWFFTDGEAGAGFGELGSGAIVFLSLAFVSIVGIFFTVGGNRRIYTPIRGELLSLIRAKPMDKNSLVEIMKSLESAKIDDSSSLANVSIIVEEFQEDVAMHIYQLAHRCLKAN